MPLPCRASLRPGCVRSQMLFGNGGLRRREEQPDEVCGMMATRSQPYSILITDDDSGCREALRSIVEPEGFYTLMASSGEEALDIVREEPVDLALLDMYMPTLTGLETLQ